jgi:hypothetical protein
MSRKRPTRTPVSTVLARKASPGRSWLFGTVILIWWFGGYGLAVYGVVADRGPFAFLLDWQSAVFGGSNIILGVLAGAVVVFWGPPLLARVYLRLRPNSPLAAAFKHHMDTAMMSRGEAANVARARWDRLDDVARQAFLRRRRNWAPACAVIFVLGSWGIATFIRVSANADAGRPLTPLALRANTPMSLDGASRWVHVTNASPVTDATIERDYDLRGTAYRDFYTPLVTPGWQGGERIFLVEEDDSFPDDEKPSGVVSPRGPVEGEISMDGLRPDVARSFQRNGYAVGDWTAVLRRVTALRGVVPGEDGFIGILIWLIGGGMASLSLLVALLAEIRRRTSA